MYGVRRFGSTANTSESRKSVKIGTPSSITGSVEIPRQSQSRREVIPVAIVETWKSRRAHLHKSDGRVEVAQQVVALFDNAKIVPTQSEIERKLGAPAKVSCK